jgi:hypothetical protein
MNGLLLYLPMYDPHSLYPMPTYDFQSNVMAWTGWWTRNPTRMNFVQAEMANLSQYMIEVRDGPKTSLHEKWEDGPVMAVAYQLSHIWMFRCAKCRQAFLSYDRPVGLKGTWSLFHPMCAMRAQRIIIMFADKYSPTDVALLATQPGR